MDPVVGHDARPVRLARPRARGSPHPIRPSVAPRGPTPPEPPPGPEAAPKPLVERRPNRAATQRAVRLSLLYAVGVAAVYGVLVGVASAGPTGGTIGTEGALLAAGLLALLLAVVGIVYALGTAPRGVELSDDRTVVVGRFGRRYSFPGRRQLRPTVHQRFPAGLLSPVAVESVAIAGGSTRRTFLLEEHLLDPVSDETAPAS
jgi:hypothetical protein